MDDDLRGGVFLPLSGKLYSYDEYHELAARRMTAIDSLSKRARFLIKEGGLGAFKEKFPERWLRAYVRACNRIRMTPRATP